MKYEQLYKGDDNWLEVNEQYVRLKLQRYFDNVEDIMGYLHDGGTVNTTFSLFRVVAETQEESR